MNSNIIYDKTNDIACRIVNDYYKYFITRDDLFFVIGGDGFFMKSVKEYYLYKKPFIGLNAGHLGYLLNQVELSDIFFHTFFENLTNDGFIFHELYLLDVIIYDKCDKKYMLKGFNESYIRNESTQASWLKVFINEQCRFEKLVGDGILISTPQGSTAYARSMGGPPLPIGTNALVMVGNNVFEPFNWKPVILPLNVRIEIENLDCGKRPVLGVVDNTIIHDVKSMSVHISNEFISIGFAKYEDLLTKISKIQFPLN